MRLLVDTNVYLEHILEREKCDLTRSFFKSALFRKNQILITSMSLRDIEYLCNKKCHDKEVTRKIMVGIYSMVHKVVPITADAAIESMFNDIKDYEDSIQMIAAQENMCDAIITYNKKDFAQSKLPVFTPEEMLDIWKKSNK